MKDTNFLIQSGINVNKSLELFGDINAYNETLIDFLETVKEKLENIEKYKEVSDMTNYAILVHSLKSDAKYLGFTTLAELSYQHEMKSKENDRVYVYENYDTLIKEAHRIINVVTQYLGKEPIITETVENRVKDKKILVVDDSDIMLHLLSKIFNDEFEVLTAKDGKEALDIISNVTPLFGMLLDLNMPNVNGFSVLEHFEQTGLFTKIPVAIITGDDTKETVSKAFTYPIVDVLTKPFNERDIKRVVNSMQNFH